MILGIRLIEVKQSLGQNRKFMQIFMNVLKSPLNYAFVLLVNIAIDRFRALIA